MNNVDAGTNNNDLSKQAGPEDLSKAIDANSEDLHIPKDRSKVDKMIELPEKVLKVFKMFDDFDFEAHRPEGTKDLPVLGPYQSSDKSYDKSSTYHGQFRHGRPHGLGISIRDDFSWHRGYHVDGVRQGYGVSGQVDESHG